MMHLASFIIKVSEKPQHLVRQGLANVKASCRMLKASRQLKIADGNSNRSRP